MAGFDLRRIDFNSNIVIDNCGTEWLHWGSLNCAGIIQKRISLRRRQELLGDLIARRRDRGSEPKFKTIEHEKYLIYFPFMEHGVEICSKHLFTMYSIAPFFRGLRTVRHRSAQEMTGLHVPKPTTFQEANRGRTMVLHPAGLVAGCVLLISLDQEEDHESKIAVFVVLFVCSVVDGHRSTSQTSPG
jgi:hypothetical protein